MPSERYEGPLERVNAYCWRIPKSYKEGMRVDGLIYSSEEMINQVKGDQAPEQVANVAFLPGIQVASLAMPDIHQGYGFPIGGVAAFDADQGGVVSAGGVGFDISCGVRNLRTGLSADEILRARDQLAEELYRRVPAGVGSTGSIRLDAKQMDAMLLGGARYALKRM